jgi:hypothetical protein
MKTTILWKRVAVLAVSGLMWSATTVLAQNSPAATSATAPQLAYGVPQVLQLAQAKVSDDTIIAYIKNTGNSYGLTADQIIYIRQQGVSDAVLTAMLNQPKPAVIPAAAPAPQPAVSTASYTTTSDVSTATVAPTVTYIQTVPATTYYYQPYYYPSYCWYPPVSLSFGWVWGGSGWHGGGYYHGGGGGGYHGGWHGGGWHH